MARNAETTYFPQLPAAVWWKLRKKFVQTVPGSVSETYLTSTLSIQPGAAKIYLKDLQALGLVDKNNKPTDLAFDWRDDAKYADACKKILDRVYPSDLRDVAPLPNPDRAAIVRWFSNSARLGEGAAKNKTAQYLLLADGNPSKGDDKPAGTERRANRTQKIRKRPNGKSATAADTMPPISPAGSASPSPHSKLGVDPTIQLNIQIHISADASPDQINAIFSSMAKYLRDGDAS